MDHRGPTDPGHPGAPGPGDAPGQEPDDAGQNVWGGAGSRSSARPDRADCHAAWRNGP